MENSSPPSSSGRIPLTASAPVPIGRAAEPRVLGVVTDLLADHHVVRNLPARDQHGEDGRLSVDGTPCTLQVTGVPHAPDFWRRVATQGSATTSATLQEMSAWLKSAVNTKYATLQPSERPNTIIALDAHQWADQVVHPHVISALSSSGLNPAQRLGLAGIAVVGQGTSNSTWLPGRLT